MALRTRRPTLTVVYLAAALTFAHAALGSNLIVNPTFEGTGGLAVGAATGEVPDNWRAFAVGGGAITTSILPVGAHELFTGSAPTNAVRLSVTTFGSDQGFDDDNARFPLTPGESYHLEFYVKTGNANGSSQAFRVGFPLFTSSGTYLGREPGKRDNLTAGANWTRVVCPTFSDPQAGLAHISFRLNNDGGENSILIAWPTVGDPLERFSPPDAEAIAQRPTWLADQRVVGTTYFYWYRWPDLHFFDDAQHTDDALTDHFVDPTSVSMMSRQWHKTELNDMIEAGIDTLWPVYWAAPGNFDHPVWSLYVKGLVPLQEARDELIAEGKKPPLIGMFYDTSSLLNSVRGVNPIDGKADLTTAEGRDIFYHTIRSFWASVHPRHWACIDGRPITVLYASAFAAAYNQAAIDYVYSRFEAEFAGVRPYIIRELSWNVQTEARYQWGAALHGAFIHDVAALGPGYDDIAVPRVPNYFRSREEGNFYRDSWNTVLNAGRNIVHVETWNEMHEGTDICESVEYGRQYIEMTREFASRFTALRVTGMVPVPGSKLAEKPTSVVLQFGQPVDPATFNPDSVMLTRAGEDGLLDTDDDVVVVPASMQVSGRQLTLDLTGVDLPEQDYRLVLTTAVHGLSGRPLYGNFDGAFPTGADQAAAPFEVQFIVSHEFAKSDLDEDDDVDQSDFGILQACFSGQGIAQNNPACQKARLDGDSDVDAADVVIFIGCLSGPGVQADLNCGK